MQSWTICSFSSMRKKRTCEVAQSQRKVIFQSVSYRCVMPIALQMMWELEGLRRHHKWGWAMEMENQPAEHDTSLTKCPERVSLCRIISMSCFRWRATSGGVLIQDTKTGSNQRTWQLSGQDKITLPASPSLTKFGSILLISAIFNHYATIIFINMQYLTT